MSSYQFVGVDVAKDKFDVALKIADRWDQVCFPNSKTGYQQFIKWLTKHTNQPHIAMEATGHYSALIAQFLFDRQLPVYVINPLQIKNFARAKLTRNKTDSIDAKLIAEYAEKMQPYPYQPRSDAQKEVKDLTNLLDTLKQQHTRLSNNQLHSVQGKIAKELLKKLLKELEKEIIPVQSEIAKLIKRDSMLDEMMTLLISIPGIGKITAYKLISTIVDISHFKSPKQFAAYLGVSPRQHQSGKYEGKTTMSRLGNAHLRKTLYIAALVAKRFNLALQPLARRLKEKGKSPKSVTGAVMRKLAHIVFGVLKNKQPFKFVHA